MSISCPECGSTQFYEYGRTTYTQEVKLERDGEKLSVNEGTYGEHTGNPEDDQPEGVQCALCGTEINVTDHPKETA